MRLTEPTIYCVKELNAKIHTSIPINHLTDAEKDSIKEQVVADIQGNKHALEMDEVKDERDNTLKQSSNDYMRSQKQKTHKTNQRIVKLKWKTHTT